MSIKQTLLKSTIRKKISNLKHYTYLWSYWSFCSYRCKSCRGSSKNIQTVVTEVVCSVQDLPASCSRQEYFDMELLWYAIQNRSVGQYFLFASTTILPKVFLKEFLRSPKNKDVRNIFVAEKILSHNFDNVTVYVALHDTLSSNMG